MQKPEATVRSFFGKCSSLRPSFAQMCEVIEGTLIRRLLFPIQGGIPVWPLLDRVRGLVSQWIHRTLGLRGSPHGNDNVPGVMHSKLLDQISHRPVTHMTPVMTGHDNAVTGLMGLMISDVAIRQPRPP